MTGEPMSDDLLIVPFKPHVHYWHCDGDDYVEYINEDAPCYYERVDATLELIRHMETKKVIGARIYASLSLQIGSAD